MEDGDIAAFKVYDSSENQIYNAQEISENIP